jgi:hypothetical protein
VPRPLRQTRAALTLAVATASFAALAAAPAEGRRLIESTETPPATTTETPPPTVTPPPTGTTGEVPAPETPTPRSERRSRRGGRCALSMQADPASTVPAGETVALNGRLTCPEAAAGEGQPVTIYQRLRGTGRTELETVTTGPEGSFTLDPAVSANSIFIARAIHAGSARVKVKVTDAVTLAGPADAGAALLTRSGAPHARQSNRFTFTGTLAPATPGIRVSLQRRYASTGEPWHTIGSTHSNEEGGFSFIKGLRAGGEVDFRAVAHLRGHVASYSPQLTYTVAQAQNPQLTIAAATDPLPSGQSTTISGTLTDGAGHAVTLLARAPGHGFTPVTTVQSGEGGAFEFTVAPTVSTTYRVLSGKTVSTQLLLAVLPLLSLQTPPTTAVAEQPASFQGTVAGVSAGTPVRLEREHPEGRFWPLSSSTVQADGSFLLSYAFPRTGSYVLRVLVPAGASAVGAASETFTVLVTAVAPAS